MLSDITRDGVEAAIEEFDRLGRAPFLAKYGFGPARDYFILHDGRRYDSKAICGAAHGYDRPTEGPLPSASFSGGDATVARLLERLGFALSRRSAKTTGWTSEERILALDLYLRHGAIGRTNPEVVALSHELNDRRFHPYAGTRDNFRNPNAVALKLANFASLDPSYIGSGMTRHSAGDEETWSTYAGDANLLAQAVEAIRSGREPAATERLAPAPSPSAHPIERRGLDFYEVTPALDPIYAERREAELVERFARWLTERGSTVTAHHYGVVKPPLRNDLADETHQRLWEAKADVSRGSVRMALGQLLDYLRFEPPTWSGGVLLPLQPSADLIDLIHRSGRAAAWPASGTTFVTTEA